MVVEVESLLPQSFQTPLAVELDLVIVTKVVLVDIMLLEVVVPVMVAVAEAIAEDAAAQFPPGHML